MGKTVLSVRDFAILLDIANKEIFHMNERIRLSGYGKSQKERDREYEERLNELHKNHYYQDLLRIRDKLGELHIEVETPDIEIKKN